MSNAPLPYDAVVLDIEGTTTPITFVYDALFPYAARALEGFIQAQWAQVEPLLESLASQAREDAAQGLDAPQFDDTPSPAQVLANLRWQMQHDRKTTALKTLQGLIWREGYAQGQLRGALFEDVLPALRAWQDAKIPAYIYSSGSVEAQQLLFGHSVHGDLRPLLAGYFDTTTGPKREADSYRAIAQAIGCAPERVLFATDHPLEAEAAVAAGMQAALMTRPGNAALPELAPAPTYDSFDALLP